VNNFVNRDEEIVNSLQYIKEGKHISIFGITGIGKTIFTESFIKKIEIDSLKIFVEIKNNLSEKDFLLQIAEEIDEKIPGQIFLPFKERLEEDKDDIFIYFRVSFRKVLEQANILLIIDNEEKISRDLWETIEDEILRIFIDDKAGKLQIITVGQRPMRWDFFRMRDNTAFIELKKFNRPASAQMVRMLAKKIKNSTKALETVYQLSQGHPECIGLAVKCWTNEYTGPLDGNAIEYCEGLAALMDEFIDKKILSPISASLQAGEDGEDYPETERLRSLLQCLAQEDELSPRIFRETLRKHFSDFYENKRTIFFDKFFKKLTEHDIIQWNDDKRGYEFPSIVRHLLSENLKIEQSKTGVSL
jgi:hypothetical protein